MKNEEICKILCLPRDVNCGDGHIENCVWVKNGRAVAAAAEAQVQAKTLAWIQEIDPLVFNPDYKFSFDEVIKLLQEYMQSTKPTTPADKIKFIESIGVPVDKFKIAGTGIYEGQFWTLREYLEAQP